MSKISEMTRESWIKATFPEWGTWLVEDIENEVVPEGQVAMWWLGCTGIWFKTPGGANITIDLWCGNGKRTHGNGKMAVGHQMANMCGGRAMQPNLRNVPFVIDPFAFKQVDAVLATHYHQDHMSAEWAAHVINSGMTTTDENGNEIPVPFIGPKKSAETWIKWGVPEDRIQVVKPGDVIKIKDIEIVCLDSFDKTVFREYRHLKTSRGVSHSRCVEVRAEADDVAVFCRISLQTFENGLRVLQNTCRLGDRYGRIIDESALIPCAVPEVRDKSFVCRHVSKTKTAPVDIFLFHILPPA